MKRYLILLLLLAAGVLPLAAQEQAAAQPAAEEEPVPAHAPEAPAPGEPTAVELWDSANAAYVEGDFGRAAKCYGELLARGESSARLYYNLGNACFKENRLGEAILYYRRALRLQPGNEDARYNLSVAEARTKDTIERIPEFGLTTWVRAVRHLLGCTAWSLLSLGLLAATLACVLVYLLSARLALRKTGFYGMVAGALLVLIATLFALGERREILDRTQAVVMVSSVSVKSSPDKASTDLFVLHEGTTVRITDRLDAWCEIAIADGKQGWIEASKIETI